MGIFSIKFAQTIWSSTMIIFDFITQEEIDDLPDDDPQTAFVTFVRIAQRKLGERTSEISRDEDGWDTLNEARHGFMNIVIAAAKKYEVEPFASLAVPFLSNFDSRDHLQFKSDLDHYMTQLLLDNSSRSKRDSVLITDELRNSIRTYIFHLRELIEKSEDLSKPKQEILLRKLREFEDELEKKRLNMMAVTVLAITLASAPGGIWASGDIASKLVTNILKVVGEAKIADDGARRLPSSAERMVITGPRPIEPTVKNDFGNKTQRKSRTSTDDINDDIPF